MPYLDFPHKRIGNIDRGEINEASGICWHSQRKTLFIVGDNGDLYEITTDGQMIRKKRISKGDFEGITHNPETGLLYIAIEGRDTIIEVNPDTFEVSREFPVPRAIEGKILMRAGGSGLEAITFIPDREHAQGGIFYIANQSSHLNKKEELSAVFQVELPLRNNTGEPKLLSYFTPEITDLSGLHYDPVSDHIFVASDKNDLLLEYSRTHTLVQAYALLGISQEGITADSEGNFYIAQDAGGIIKYR